MIEQAFITIDGAHIATWSRGHGTPLVTFLAGGLCDHRSWLPQLESLNDDWRVVTIDPRGCGMSTQAGPYGILQQAQDAAAVIASESSQPTVVVSHSLGGYVALALNHFRPELVAANVFIDVPLSKTGADTTLLIHALRESGVLIPLSGMVEAMSSTANHEVRATIRDMMLTRPVDVAIGMLSNLEVVTENVEHYVLEAYEKPILAIWPGPRPRGGDPDWLATMCPGIQQEFLNGAGHFVQLEQPAEVCRLIERFVAGLPS